MTLFARFRRPRRADDIRRPRRWPIDGADVLVLGGLTLVVAGLDRYSRPLAMIVAGVAVTALGLVLATLPHGGARGSR